MRRMIILLLAVALPFLPTGPAAAQGTLRIGMTASDIPYTGGQTDNREHEFAAREAFLQGRMA
jgi:peptide/nickel transport system substrate-binding protein